MSNENLSAKDRLFQWLSENPPVGMSQINAQRALNMLIISVEAPDDLECFGMLLDAHPYTLDRLLGVANKDQRNLIESRFFIDDQKTIIRHLLATEESWAGCIEKPLRRNEFVPGVMRTNHPMHGRLDELPFYSMAISKFDGEGEISEDYYKLKGIMLLGHWVLLLEVVNSSGSEEEGDGDVENKEAGYLSNATSSMKEACRKVRHCRRKEVFDYYTLLHDIDSAELLFNRLKDEIEDRVGSNQSTDKPFNDIRNSLWGFINRAFGTGKSLDKKGGGGGRGRKGGVSYFHDGYIFYQNGVQSEQAPTSSGNSTSIISVLRTSVVPKEWLLADLDPMENVSEDEWVLPSSNSGTGGMLTRRSVRHVEMHNQHFRTSWSQASLSEIAAFLDTFEHVLADESKSNHTRQSAFLALVMFWTGAPFDHAISRCRYASAKATSKAGHELVIADGQSEGESSINIRPYTAIQQFIPSKEQVAYCEPNLSIIQIPDIMGLSSFIPQIFELYGTNKSQPLFAKMGKKKQAFRSEITSILKRIPNEMRLNEHRISFFFST